MEVSCTLCWSLCHINWSLNHVNNLLSSFLLELMLVLWIKRFRMWDSPIMMPALWLVDWLSTRALWNFLRTTAWTLLRFLGARVESVFELQMPRVKRGVNHHERLRLGIVAFIARFVLRSDLRLSSTAQVRLIIQMRILLIARVRRLSRHHLHRHHLHGSGRLERLAWLGPWALPLMMPSFLISLLHLWKRDKKDLILN